MREAKRKEDSGPGSKTGNFPESRWLKFIDGEGNPTPFVLLYLTADDGGDHLEGKRHRASIRVFRALINVDQIVAVRVCSERYPILALIEFFDESEVICSATGRSDFGIEESHISGKLFIGGPKDQTTQPVRRDRPDAFDANLSG
jgi:hypothetical protein